jgi:hypothetical protein
MTKAASPPAPAAAEGDAHATADRRVSPETCDRCGRELGRRYRFSLDGQSLCLRCVARHGKLLRRSFFTALVVGTLLTAINNGGAIASDNLALALAWKVPLTYCSPFLVATWGGIVNARMREAPAAGG